MKQHGGFRDNERRISGCPQQSSKYFSYTLD